MSVQLFRSSFNSSWIEIRQGDQILQEFELLFPLKRLPEIFFLSVEEALFWLQSTERKMAKNQALRFLARQSLASSMLFYKLQKRGYSKEICQAIIDECRQSGYLPDDEIWPRVIEKELACGYGPRWIEWKWKSKGLPDGLVATIATTEKQRKAIRKLMQKQTNKERKKMVAILLKRGFQIEQILQEIEIF